MATSDYDDVPGFSARVRTVQIIVGSLLLGSGIFGVIAYILRSQDQRPLPADPFLTYLMAGLGVMQFVFSFIVPRMVLASALAQRDSAAPGEAPRLAPRSPMAEEVGRLLLLHQTTLIIGCALIEASIFMQCIAYIIEGQQISMILGALLWVVLLFKIPRRDQIEQWLDRQRERALEG